MKIARTLYAFAIASYAASPSLAQAPPAAEAPPNPAAAKSAQDLAKQLSNPLASLISVPIQTNFDFDIGPDDGYRITTNVQPVIPIALNDRTNLVVRTIVPIIYQDGVTASNSEEFGLGDTLQSFFISPDPGPSGIVWGVGPVFLYPTATSRSLGGEKWGAGITSVILKQSGQNTIGLLANHVWSVAGDDARPDLSSTFIQPFFSHTTRKATTYALNSEASYDWTRDSWSVPINVSVSQLARIGKQPVSIGAGARYYIERPTGGADWGLRLIFTLLYPKK